MLNGTSANTFTLEGILAKIAAKEATDLHGKRKKTKLLDIPEEYLDIAKRYYQLKEEVNGKVGHNYIARHALKTKVLGYQAKETSQYPSPSNSWTSKEEQNFVDFFYRDVSMISGADWPESRKKILRKLEISLELIRSKDFWIFFTALTTALTLDIDLKFTLTTIVDELNQHIQIKTSVNEILEIMRDPRFVRAELAELVQGLSLEEKQELPSKNLPDPPAASSSNPTYS